jgi:N-dimethylarginine dimethylaminohydrolase
MLFKYLRSGMRWGGGRASGGGGGFALHLDDDRLGVGYAATGKRRRRHTALMLQPGAVALEVRPQRLGSTRLHLFLHFHDLRKKLNIGQLVVFSEGVPQYLQQVDGPARRVSFTAGFGL